MPFNVSVRNVRRAPAVSPMASGGYRVNDQPDPNDAMATYGRSHALPPVGAYTSAAMPVSGLPPTVTPSGESALSANLALSERARANTQQYESGEAARRVNAGNAGVSAVAPMATLPNDRRFDALFEALAESGVGKLRTAAAGRMGAPGFFDQQDPMNLQRQQLLDQLAARDMNMYGRVR